MSQEHDQWMRVAIQEAERARGSTGDNPWVGCVITTADGVLIGKGHTLGTGEDHAEISAARQAQSAGHSIVGATLYSTLEPCAFHGRTPACSKSIVQRDIARVFIGMRDPHPRVNGEGVRILQTAGVEVVEGVCENLVRAQLGPWVLQQHPHEIVSRSKTLPQAQRDSQLANTYGVAVAQIQALLCRRD